MMTLEQLIEEYRDLAEQAIAFHRAHYPEKSGWVKMVGPLFCDGSIATYRADDDAEHPAEVATIGKFSLHLYNDAVEFPFTAAAIQRMRDELPAMREALMKAVLLGAIEKETAS